MRFLIPAIAALAFAMPATAPAQLVTGTPEQKLQKLLLPHAYYGGHVTDDIRRATGDPNIPVIDRRWQWGEIYTCNYVFLQGRGRGRALVCE